MQDNTLFKYKIDKIDTERKTLYVTFQDGAKIVIPLILPFPRNNEELDAVVSRFTKPKEILDAEQADPKDLSIFEEVVGLWREAKRYSYAERFNQTQKETP